MHKKRIQKFQNPGGDGIQSTTPGVQNTGFSLLQQLSPSISTTAPTPSQTSKIEGISEEGENKTPFFESKAGKGVMMAAQIGQMVGDAFINSGFANYKENGNTELRKNLSAAGRQAVQTFMPGWGHVIAAADSLVEGLGGKTDTSEGLGVGNDIGNMVASIALPGAGWLVGKTDKYSQSEAIKKSSAYTGEAAAGEKVAKNAGAKLLFGRGVANAATRKQKLRDINTEGILADAKDAFQASNYGGFSIGNQMTLSGGVRPLRVKKGAKLDKLINARNIIKRAAEEVVEIEEFREGGKVNVIPGGHLHMNRHHMEDIGDEYKDLTTKGIPVVTEGDGGELVQQAEIERDEIIFNIDVTKKLEELMEDGSDEATLEAGKLLAIEIMENTVDNTGLMKEIS